MKILLLKPGVYENDTKNLMLDPSTLPPLGLLYLGAVLEKEGHNVEILDFCMEEISKERLKKELISTDAV
ncbi:MAG: radical SAM protein, partial [Thermoplasmatales archaeon]